MSRDTPAFSVLATSAFLSSETAERVIAVPRDFTGGGGGGGGGSTTTTLVPALMYLRVATPVTTRISAAAISNGMRQLGGIRSRTDLLWSGIGVSIDTEGVFSTGYVVVCASFRIFAGFNIIVAAAFRLLTSFPISLAIVWI